MSTSVPPSPPSHRKSTRSSSSSPFSSSRGRSRKHEEVGWRERGEGGRYKRRVDREKKRENCGRWREDDGRKYISREEERRRSEKEKIRRDEEERKINIIDDESREIAGLEWLNNTKEINRMYRKTEVFWLNKGRNEVPKDGYEKLKIPGIFIKQKYEAIEVLAGFETENRYKVYATDFDGNHIGASLFEVKEISNLFLRCCLSGDCRPFTLYFLHNSNALLSNDGQLFMKVERKCRCTFLCYSRPELNIYVQEFDEDDKSFWSFIGSVIHEHSFFKMIMKVYDCKHEEVFKVEAPLFQTGIWASKYFPCEGCQAAFFYIYDCKDQNKIIGILERREKGTKFSTSDADSFSINFPYKATLKERALLMAVAFLIDYRYFEHSVFNYLKNTKTFIEF